MTARELADRLEKLHGEAPDAPFSYDGGGAVLDAHNDVLFWNSEEWDEDQIEAIVSLRNSIPDISRTLRDQADEIDSLQGQAVVQAMQVGNLMRERDALRAEMSVHETPDGGVAGMLTIQPEVIAAWKEGEDE